MDEGEAVDVIYCDIMKAFDQVPHGRLLKKVELWFWWEDIAMDRGFSDRKK